jgi:hypothetical protein
MHTASPARIDEVLALLRGIDNRLVRIETLVDRDLGKDGTLEKMGQKVDGLNTRVLLMSGVTTAAFNAFRFLPQLFK